MSRNKFHYEGLSFNCSKKLNEFDSRENGFNCQTCKKSIVDFREKTKKEYDEIVKTDKTVCGIFNGEQIGYDKIRWKNIFLTFSFVGTILLGNELKAQDNTINDSLKINSTDTLVTEKHTIKSVESKGNKISTKTDTNNHRQRRKRKLHMNSRFPFVHYNRKYRVFIGYPATFW